MLLGLKISWGYQHSNQNNLFELFNYLTIHH